MRLERLEQFIAVADTGSLRGAARQLNLSQPAITRAIQQLEHDLGLSLLARSGKGVSLTQAGVAFLARARVAASELRKATEEARNTVNDGSGLLALGVSPVGASLLLPELAIHLHKHHPKSRLRILETTPSALLSLVREEVMDLAVTQLTRIHLDAGLDYRPLLNINMRVAVRVGHPLLAKARPRPLKLSDLVGMPWVYMTAHDSHDDIVSRSFLAEGLALPLPAVHCGSYFVALDLISSTDMIGVLPPGLLRSRIASGQLREVVLSKPLIPIDLGLYTRKGSPHVPALKSAIQHIVTLSNRLARMGELKSLEPLST